MYIKYVLHCVHLSDWLSMFYDVKWCTWIAFKIYLIVMTIGTSNGDSDLVRPSYGTFGRFIRGQLAPSNLRRSVTLFK